ncbi:hypothetical protein AB0I52_16960 [Streptomyces sp. NPDC050423]|uniref:hypothetical protein n=1 Tax=Streptomyces sp. NPDC050423 TaxID=3155402 RepID=UPI003425BDBF
MIGDKDSDHPVILPMDAHELDIWRRMHPSYDYWCGLHLGGCGGQLTDRRYTNKVCHFAHHATAPVCYRTANGESSADHLFIKRGVRRLMDKRQLRGRVQTRDLGNGPGDAVDVYLAESRRRLRFQLGPIDYRAWRGATDELGADAADIDWIFAAEGQITQQVIGSHGYCLRVRCETVGGERRVHIGAEARDRTVAWTPLEDCALTPSGIVTPHVEEIRLSRPRPRPIAIPIHGRVVFALVPGTAVPDDSPFAARDRQLVVADVKPVEGPIVRTVVSLPGDTDAPPAEHVYRVSDGARILLSGSAGSWAIETTRYVRVDAHEAERTGLWTPPTRPVLKTDADSVGHRSRTGASSTPSVPAPAAKARTAPAQIVQPARAPLARTDLVSALRDALETHARLHSTTTWATLVRTVSPDLASHSESERCELLFEVDAPLWEHVPILSALIREGDAPLPYLPQVLSRMGVRHSEASTQIKRWAAVETERAFAAYGTPSRTMPPRYPLKPEAPVVSRAARVVEAEYGTVRCPHDRPVTVAKYVVRTTAADSLTVKRLRELARELAEVLARLDGPARKRARKVVGEAQSWLAHRDGAGPSQGRAVVRKSAAYHVRALRHALKVAQVDIREAEQRRRAAKKEEARLFNEARDRQKAKAAHAEPSAEQLAPAGADPVERITQQLVGVAVGGGTIPIHALDTGGTGHGARHWLIAIDHGVTADVPLLSALVTKADGGPVPFFRDILMAAGLAVPQTDEALLKVWCREQERDYAAYGNPPRELPPRLVPKAGG